MITVHYTQLEPWTRLNSVFITGEDAHRCDLAFIKRFGRGYVDSVVTSTEEKAAIIERLKSTQLYGYSILEITPDGEQRTDIPRKELER